jgi:hypothetical protein
MNAVRAFLILSVAIWTPYAIYCIFAPDFLEGVAGLAASTSTGTTEIRAMYGGLQAGIGLFCLAALFRADWVRPALLMLCFLTGGLAVTRGLGLMIDGSASGYTLSALAFETLNAAAAIWLLRTLPPGEPIGA